MTICRFIHLRDQALYARTHVHTMSLRNPEEPSALHQFTFQLEEHHSIHISTQLLHSAYSVGFGYLVHWYLCTGLLPFEEFSDEEFQSEEEMLLVFRMGAPIRKELI